MLAWEVGGLRLGGFVVLGRRTAGARYVDACKDQCSEAVASGRMLLASVTLRCPFDPRREGVRLPAALIHARPACKSTY